MVRTRTSSPYFSPNRATAPAAMAASGVISSVVTGTFWRMTAFTSSSTRAISSSVIGALWLKSKRMRSASTI